MAHSCRPEDASREINIGMKDGLPLCCIAQYVSDGFNVETWDSALQRKPGYSDVAQNYYVLCWDCQDQQGSSTG